jgi:hypothetical protein
MGIEQVEELFVIIWFKTYILFAFHNNKDQYFKLMYRCFLTQFAGETAIGLPS